MASTDVSALGWTKIIIFLIGIPFYPIKNKKDSF